jgi:hypothetical protein
MIADYIRKAELLKVNLFAVRLPKRLTGVGPSRVKIRINRQCWCRA